MCNECGTFAVKKGTYRLGPSSSGLSGSTETPGVAPLNRVEGVQE
jgi:hypothetical protein